MSRLSGHSPPLPSCCCCCCLEPRERSLSRKIQKRVKKQPQQPIKSSWRLVKDNTSLLLDGFDVPPGQVEFPATVQEITFIDGFNGSLAGLKWPPQLRVVKFDTEFERSGDTPKARTTLQGTGSPRRETRKRGMYIASKSASAAVRLAYDLDYRAATVSMPLSLEATKL